MPGVGEAFSRVSPPTPSSAQPSHTTGAASRRRRSRMQPSPPLPLLLPLLLLPLLLLPLLPPLPTRCRSSPACTRRRSPAPGSAQTPTWCRARSGRGRGGGGQAGRLSGQRQRRAERTRVLDAVKAGRVQTHRMTKALYGAKTHTFNRMWAGTATTATTTGTIANRPAVLRPTRLGRHLAAPAVNMHCMLSHRHRGTCAANPVQPAGRVGPESGSGT